MKGLYPETNTTNCCPILFGLENEADLILWGAGGYAHLGILVQVEFVEKVLVEEDGTDEIVAKMADFFGEVQVFKGDLDACAGWRWH